MSDLDREQALAEFAALEPGEAIIDIFLPPELLEQITAEDLPVDLVVGVGTPHEEERYVDVVWDGRLVRNADGSFWSTISHEISPAYWLAPVGARFYIDLLHKCVLSRLDAIDGLTLEEYDISDEEMFRLEYGFPVGGINLREVFKKARDIQEDIESPAEQVLDDVTRALARSADKILRGHYAPVSELIARVEAAESPAEKGSSLESLMAALFEQVPGFVVYERNVRTETEEIDLVILNDSHDPVFSKDGPIILVECKNWTAKPGRPEFSQLEIKVRNRHERCTVAFFISWSGFAETTWREAMRVSRENYVIVCLTGSDVRIAALDGTFPEFLRQATFQALNK